MIRSIIEIFDLNSGQSRKVLESAMHCEAPNWTPDGLSLIVNADGLVYRVEIATGDITQVDTGPYVACNNDHGVSPDGTRLMICDKLETGKSCIYSLPVTGGEAERVTELVPSWFHGWSPDGQSITYTAVRDGQFCIATCAANGADERVLITSLHHYDGPDYTPDGEWIWFNSDRGGNMDLWRIRPDGTNVQQMTSGPSVDWFPHPSPDGKCVVFLAYPAGTEGHPFGCDVELRLIPADGGPPEILTALFGGQGTLNVPSWAPDSTCFAYVRYPETP